MPQNFDALDDLAAEMTVLAFGEEAILTPRRGSAYVEAASDSDRLATRVQGIISVKAANSDLRGQARGGDFRGSASLQSEQTEFWMARSAVAALGFRPSRGDLLTLTARPQLPTFSIAAVEATALGDLNLILVREDMPS